MFKIWGTDKSSGVLKITRACNLKRLQTILERTGTSDFSSMFFRIISPKSGINNSTTEAWMLNSFGATIYIEL